MSHPLIKPATDCICRSQRQTPLAFFQRCRASSTSISRRYSSFPAGESVRSASAAPLRGNTNSSPFFQLGSRSRGFSSTTISQATVVKQNPRADDDGNDMTIEISERAAKRLRQITKTPQKKNSLTGSADSPPDSHLRVTVTSGGCHGFQYLMSLEGASKIDAEEDTIFASPDDAGDGHAEVVMDNASLELLKGSTVDYTTELIGSQFKIVGNPRAKSSCGCGTSFDIE